MIRSVGQAFGRRLAWLAAPLALALWASPAAIVPAAAQIGHGRPGLAVPTRVDLFGAGVRARRVAQSGPASGGPKVAAPRAATATGTRAPMTVQLSGFPLTSLDQQTSLFGSTEHVAPPDTMVAAGPTLLLEMVNRTASLWTKGGALLTLVDSNNVLPLPVGYVFTDPRVLFDAPSGRFFFSGVASDRANDSRVLVGVTATSDPRNGFLVYQLAPTSNGELHDQPKIGVCDDKVVVAWDDFTAGSVYAGTEIWVLQKSALLSGAAAVTSSFGPTLGLLSSVPAQSLTSTTTGFVVHNAGTSVALMEINGTPAQTNVTLTTYSVAIPPDTIPPQAIQPAGPVLNTGDARLLSAVWRSGMLLTSGNTYCVPPGDTAAHSCLRLLAMSTVAAPSLVQSINFGRQGLDLFYPAVTSDATGDVFVAYTASSAVRFASALVTEIPNAPNAMSMTWLISLGAKGYFGSLWGDYSSISVDPANGNIWAAAEYAPSGSLGNWGTAVGQLMP